MYMHYNTYTTYMPLDPWGQKQEIKLETRKPKYICWESEGQFEAV